jgi:IS30 family transposase
VPDFERRRLAALLESHEWDTVRVAEELGVHRSTIYRRIKEFGIAARAMEEPRTVDVSRDGVRANSRRLGANGSEPRIAGST